jgi:hypothetical protein
MKPLRSGLLALLLVLVAAISLRAEPLANLPPQDSKDLAKSIPAPTGLIDSWLAEVSAIQAEQPHWATPVVTVTPRLEQEFRYDNFWTSLPHGRVLNNYGGGKGFEFIPAQNIEVILGIPPYETRSFPNDRGGQGDENLLVKYRILSANEKNGNYILTAFLGETIPTGNTENTNGHFVTTPTIAYGKGWGDFDIQTTLGISVPDNGAQPTQAGTPILWNTSLQYHLFDYLWPEVELNYSYWPNGSRDGIQQLYITPGVVFGKFKIHDRLGFTIGGGLQIPVTADAQDDRNIILTARFPF